MNSGTPMKRSTVRTLGMVKTQSWSTWGWPGREPAPMNLIRSPSFQAGGVFRVRVQGSTRS